MQLINFNRDFDNEVRALRGAHFGVSFFVGEVFNMSQYDAAPVWKSADACSEVTYLISCMLDVIRKYGACYRYDSADTLCLAYVSTIYPKGRRNVPGNNDASVV